MENPSKPYVSQSFFTTCLMFLFGLAQQSSVNLIGELLFRLTGISGKAEIEEEEGVDTGVADSSRKVLLEVLGQEKRDRVLSALYVVRQDAVGAVRTGSVHIWKALVQSMFLCFAAFFLVA